MRQLRYFLAVVDHGGMTAAARSLHLAQPSLSQAIRTLEAELETPLFERIGRRLRPTAAGEALVGPARQVLRDLEQARGAVGAVRGLAAGRLDIATLATLAVDPLARLVGVFRRRHPQLAIRLVEPESAEAVRELVLSGDCELGLAHLAAPAPDLTVRSLGSQRLVVVLPPGSGADPAQPLGFEALAELAWVASPLGSSTRTLLDESLTAHGIDPRIAVETAHREAIVPLVLAGAGSALLPTALARHARRRGAIVRATEPPVSREIALLHRRGPLAPAAAAFVELAVG
ncbi:MAG TPA: LysR substrate-binding domain-containing protein [Gaiellaceae bacterium]